MAKQNSIDLILNVKNNGQKNLQNYKKELTNLKKIAVDLQKTMANAKADISKASSNAFIKKLEQDSVKSAKQIENLKNKLKDLKGAAKGAKAGVTDTTSGLKKLAGASSTALGPLNSVSARFNTLTTASKTLGIGTAALYAGLAAMVLSLPKAVGAFAEFESQLSQIEAQLKATGNVAGFTGTALESMSQDLAKNTLASLTDVRNAISTLLTFPNIRNDNFTQTLETAQDVAAATGRGIVTVTETLGKALADPIKGLSSLRRIGITFSEEQENMIKTTYALNGAFEAQEEILKVVSSQYGGAAQGAAAGLAGTLDTLSQRLENLSVSVGSLVNDTGIIQFLGTFAQAVDNLASSVGEDGLTGAWRAFGAAFTGTGDLDEVTIDLAKLTKETQNFKNILDGGKSEFLTFDVLGLQGEFNALKETIKKEANAYQKVSEETSKKIVEFEKKKTEIILKQRLENNKLIDKATDDLYEKFLTNADDTTVDNLIKSVSLVNESLGKTLEQSVNKVEGLKLALSSLNKEGLAKDINKSIELSITDERAKEQFRLQIKQATDSSKALKKIEEVRLNDLANSSIDAAKEEIKRKEAQLKAIAAIEKEGNIEKLKSEINAAKDANKARLNILSEKEKVAGGLSIDDKLEENNLKFANKELEIQYELRNLEKAKLELATKINKTRSNYIKDGKQLSDETIKLSGDEGLTFAKDIEALKKINIDLKQTKDNVAALSNQKKLSEKGIIELDAKDFKESSDKFASQIESETLKIASKLQGATKQSLDAIIQSIDVKTQGLITKRTKEFAKLGKELPQAELDSIVNKGEFEKADESVKNVNERFLELGKDLVDGKISVDSYTEAVKKLQGVLDTTSKKIGSPIESLDTEDTLIKAAKKQVEELDKKAKLAKEKITKSENETATKLKVEFTKDSKEVIDLIKSLKIIAPDFDTSLLEASVNKMSSEVKLAMDRTATALNKIAEDFSSSLAKGIVQMANEGGTSLKQVLLVAGAEAFGNFASKKIEDLVKSGMTNGIEKVLQSDTFGSITEGLGGIFDSLGLGFLGDLFSMDDEEVQDVFVTNTDDIKGGGDEKKDDSSTGDKLLKKATGGVGGMIEKIFGFLKGDGEGAKGLGTLGVIFGPILAIYEGIKGVFDGLLSLDKDGGPLKLLSGFFTNLFDLFTGDLGFSDFFGNIKELASGFFTGIGDIFKGGFGGIKDAFAGSFAAIGDLFKGIFDFDFNLGGIGDFFKSLFNFDFGGISDFFKNLFDIDFSGISSFFKGLFDFDFGGISDFFSKLFDFSSFKTPEFDANGGIFSSVFSGLEGVLQKLVSTLLIPLKLLGGGLDFGGGILGNFFHSGGIVGKGGTKKMMNASAFANPQYFHTGGMVGSNLKSDEVAAVLQKGELVVDRNTTANLAKGNGGKQEQIVLQNFVGGDEIANSLRGNQVFGSVMLNEIKANGEQIKNALNLR